MDTANKRASAIGVMLPFMVVLPIPDGSVIQEDRQQAAFSYVGILAEDPTPTPILAPPPRIRNLTYSTGSVRSFGSSS